MSGGGAAFFSFNSKSSGGGTKSAAAAAAASASSSHPSLSKFPFFTSSFHFKNSNSSSSSSRQALSARHLPSRTTTTGTTASMSASNTTKNGLPKMTVASSPALTSFYHRSGSGNAGGAVGGPFLCNPQYSRHNSLSPRAASTVEDISLCDLFRLIARMRICVVRRVGSDVDGQISSIIDAASAHQSLNNASKLATAAGEDGDNDDDDFVAPPAMAHFISVGQQNAGQMLDWVQRKGLPLIFLNGDCIGGLTELKRLDKSGFLRECLCPHEFDLIVIGGGARNGGRNELAERAVQEAVQMGKRVALLDLVMMETTTDVDGADLAAHSDDGICSGRIARVAINKAAMMRTAIEEAKSNGWTVEGEQGQRVSFWLNWRTVREGIEQKEREEREHLEAIFQEAQIPHLTARHCQFTGFHELCIDCSSRNSNDSRNQSRQPQQQQQQGGNDDGSNSNSSGGLLKFTADRFLLVTKSAPRILEMVPGAAENCISIAKLFTLGYNPGKTLFCCESRHDAIEAAVLESAALLRGLDNDVVIMRYTYAEANPNIVANGATGQHHHADKFRLQQTALSHSSPASFDHELIAHIQEGLEQKRGVHFVTCVPTRFERLREPTSERAGIVRVYAMGTAHEGDALEKAGTGDWTPFLEEFNTVVLCMGKRVDPFQGLGLELLGIQQGTTTNHPSTNNNVLPNIYTMQEETWAEPDDGTWSGFAVRQLLKRMFQGEVCSIGPTDLCRTLLIPPNEYSCCGMSELEADRKHGIELISVYRDEDVPVMGAIKAKMLCLRPEQDRVIGLHILAPNAHSMLQGYALAMQLGLTRAQMQLMNNSSSSSDHHHRH